MKPEYGIEREWMQDGFTYMEIDVNKAKYRGIKVENLGKLGRRKFENLLIMANAKKNLKILYSDRAIYLPSELVDIARKMEEATA